MPLLLLGLLACTPRDLPPPPAWGGGGGAGGGDGPSAASGSGAPPTGDSYTPAGDSEATHDSDPHQDLPNHNECLPAGEEFSDEVCLAIVEADGRYPGVSENKSGDEAGWDDPRLTDPEFLWATEQVRRCACRCCHSTQYGGPGVYFYDLDFEPVWIDSASVWSMGVIAGWTDEPDQTLPAEDMARFEAFIEAEIDRRYAD